LKGTGTSYGHTPTGAESFPPKLYSYVGEMRKKYRMQQNAHLFYMTSTPNKIYTTNLMCGHPILHHRMQPRTLILEHFNMFQSFLFLLSLQQMMRLRFSTSCQHSCHYVQPQYAHMHSCHNGERSSMYRPDITVFLSSRLLYLHEA
jgi:hypothetical protein